MKFILILAIFASFFTKINAAEEIIRKNPTQAVELPVISKAPDFTDITRWINSEPLHIDSLEGRVVLVDFWTYSCINCLRTLPHIQRWYDTYKDKGLTVVGIHSPEFLFEMDIENVQKAVKRLGITYPVAMDNSMRTWKAYDCKYWPTKVLIDQNGRIRKVHIGEGSYVDMENAIRNLLGMPFLPINEPEKVILHPISQEVYLGFRRANRYTIDIALEPHVVASYSYSHKLLPDEVGLKGLWRAGRESITSAGSNSRIDLNFLASRVYLVLAGTSQEPIKVLLDEAPLPKEYYTQDMNSRGEIFLDGDRKYDIVNLQGKLERHKLSLIFPPGISAYAFSFGAEA
jgi:thiol-disulfide isomerase/thioredoxin